MATESGGDETGDETDSPGDETGDKTTAMADDERDGEDRWGNVCGQRSVYNRNPPSLFVEHCEILRWRNLRKTLKRWLGRLENGGWRQSPAGTRPGTRPATRRRRWLVTNETAATGGVMYTNEGKLEVDEDEMAVLEGQRLVAEFRCGNY